MWLNLVRNAKHIKKQFAGVGLPLGLSMALVFMESLSEWCHSPKASWSFPLTYGWAKKEKKECTIIEPPPFNHPFFLCLLFWASFIYLKGCLYHAHTTASICSSAATTRVPLDRESSFYSFFGNLMLPVWILFDFVSSYS